MADTLDRSVLESKAVTELKQIAKSLDLKVTGLKKADIIEKIATSANGQRAREPRTRPSKATARSRPARAESSRASASESRHLHSVAAIRAQRPRPIRASRAPATRARVVRVATARDSEDRTTTGNPECATRVQPTSGTPAQGGGGRSDRNRGRSPKGRDNRNRPREKAEPQGAGRRRRRRRGGGGGGQPFMREESWEELEAEDDPNAEIRTGILDLLPEGYGFLRTSGYVPGDKDVYVSASQVRRFRLRKGDELTGSVRSPKDSEKYQALLKIHKINGEDPDRTHNRPRFGDLTPLVSAGPVNARAPDDPRAVTARIIDLVAPIGKGETPPTSRGRSGFRSRPRRPHRSGRRRAPPGRGGRTPGRGRTSTGSHLGDRAPLDGAGDQECARPEEREGHRHHQQDAPAVALGRRGHVGRLRGDRLLAVGAGRGDAARPRAGVRRPRTGTSHWIRRMASSLRSLSRRARPGSPSDRASDR